MCLILFAWKSHARYPLIVAANRDEFLARPTAPMEFWEGEPDLLAGKDLQAGGTWMGVNRKGAFAAVTNYRDPAMNNPQALSRGHLVSDYLVNDFDAGKYLRQIATRSHQYNPFNLLLCDGEKLHCFGSEGDAPKTLEPGVYGLSNHLLDTEWPKVKRGREGLRQLVSTSADIKPDELIDLLSDGSKPEDHELPDTGVGIDVERMLGPICIQAEHYGTRSSSVVLRSQDGDTKVWEKDQLTGTIRSFEVASVPRHT